MSQQRSIDPQIREEFIQDLMLPADQAPGDPFTREQAEKAVDTFLAHGFSDELWDYFGELEDQGRNPGDEA